MSSFIGKLRTWMESYHSVVPLSILLSTSPLPPLTTLQRLRALGIYKSIPDILGVNIEDFKRQGYSDRFIELLKVASLSQRTGSIEPLKSLVEEKISETRADLELMDYTISQNMELLSVFVLLLPSILASLLFIVNPTIVATILLACSALGLILGICLGLISIPWELRIRGSVLPLIFSPVIFLVAFYIFQDPLKSLVILSIVLSPYLFKKLREELKVLEESLELARRATTSTSNIFRALEIEDPEYLLSDRFYGVSRAICVAIYLLALHGGVRLRESLVKLLEYIRDYVGYVKRLRNKTRVIFLYSAIMGMLSAVSLAFIVVVLSFLSSTMSSSTLPLITAIYMPSHEELELVKEYIRYVLAVNSLTFSLITALFRDGNPVYFPLYLLPISIAVMLSYNLTLLYVPVLLGW